MTLPALIAEISTSLTGTFARIDTWFDKDARLRAYRPAAGGWTIDEVLEHIGLTNHFLLILIAKGTTKALQKAALTELPTTLTHDDFQLDKLTEIGQHQSFAWVRPEHMEPTGSKPLAEVRMQLREQVQQCLGYLEQLKNGEGLLYKTTMSVNSLGKINVYEYLYFLAQHGRRHLTQLDKNELEFATRPR
ncbi:DinB family protein [Hymenobacter cellulosilyticus]|uniref:DinB family protein n=1 Tax=Hymenobacter cellulosilyticus TaxID=2932248 RepID=A0A8T9PXT2_9BACT|nr:DinB family protein [Hymenobacter cellulosilyticus]UOQ70084.1 DinB family protein [Hymenobacter cellulosilyticus]